MAKKKQKKVPDKDLGTAETRARVRPDPVQELYNIWLRKGYRDASALQESAIEIRQIFMIVSGGLFARATDWSGSIRGSGSPLPEWLLIKRRDVYLPWTRDINDRSMSVLMAWLIDERPLNQIDRDLRQKNGKASTQVVTALTRYAAMSGRIKPVSSI